MVSSTVIIDRIKTLRGCLSSLKAYLKPLWVNLSPTSPEALKPPFPCREGGIGGLGLRLF